MLAGALDPHLDIAPLQFKLSDILLNQKLNEFFQLFLIHSCRGGTLRYLTANQNAHRTREEADPAETEAQKTRLPRNPCS